jgi:predicted ATPase
MSTVKNASSPEPFSPDPSPDSEVSEAAIPTPANPRRRSGQPATRLRPRRTTTPETPAPITSIATRRPDFARPLPPLPTPLTSFIGRDAAIATVTAILRPDPNRTDHDATAPTDVRLLTLTGPGGVGKTRLAIHVAGDLRPDFPGGVGFVSLTAIRDPGLVLPAIAQALGARQDDRSSPAEAIQATLLGRRCLLVLDNFEQVVTAAPDITALLATCQDLTLLVTSRTPLRISGEHEVPISPLSLDRTPHTSRPDPADEGQLPMLGSEAVRLFIARATAARADLGLDGTSVDVIAEICARLDGLPLAIELAAARTRAMTPTELSSRLGDRFRLLRSAGRAENERHATLLATVDWSYQLLTSTAQLVFDRLAVFAGPADLEAVAAVVADDTLDEMDVLDALTLLVDHSLVVADQAGDTTRYRLLATMRAFAGERLVGRNEVNRIGRAHGRWVAGKLTHLLERITGPQETDGRHALEELDVFWPELREAVNNALEMRDTELAVRLVGHFGAESVLRERDELRGWIDDVLALPRMLGDQLAVNILGVAALLNWRAGRYELMSRYIQTGIELLAKKDGIDAAATLRTARVLSIVVAGDLRQASALTDELLGELAVRDRGSFQFGTVTGLRCMIDCYLGENDRALMTLEAAGPSLRNPLLRCLHSWVKTMALVDHDPAAAIAQGHRTLDFANEVSSSFIKDAASNYLTAALAQAGEADEALQTMRSVLHHTTAGGGVQSLANTVRSAIVLFTRLGHATAAAELSGWLAVQQIAIPGTAGMRAHAAEATESLRQVLGAGGFAAAQEHGAKMAASDVVVLLLAEIDRARTDAAVPGEP